MPYVFLAGGRLHYGSPGSAPREIPSDYAQQVQARHEQQQRRHGWKNQRPEGVGAGYTVWNQGAPRCGEAQVRIVGASPAPQRGQFYFLLETSAVGGLFRHDPAEGDERRIFHKEHFRATDLCPHPQRPWLACAVRVPGASHLAVIRDERFDLQYLTEGDVLDGGPSWDPRDPEALLYHSAGIGRTQDGHQTGIEAHRIMRLHTSQGRQEVLWEDARTDFLNPRMDAQGRLHCIRRPHEGMGGRVRHRDAVKDFVLAPVRVAKALYGFINLMTQIFARESLTKAHSGERVAVDTKTAWIKGRLVDLSKVDPNEPQAAPIPADWELVCREADGSLRVLASRVGDYDLGADSSVLYTDGRALHLLRPDGTHEVLHRGKDLIESVCWVP